MWVTFELKNRSEDRHRQTSQRKKGYIVSYYIECIYGIRSKITRFDHVYSFSIDHPSLV